MIKSLLVAELMCNVEKYLLLSYCALSFSSAPHGTPYEASVGGCNQSHAAILAITPPHGIPASNSCITPRSLTF